MNAGSGQPSSSGWGPINIEAGDEARVGGQFGVVNGNVHIYDIGPSATPEERFAKALNLLDGNMPRRAEELIREAAEAGHRSHRVAYYWALAVLSGRSFDHLGPDEFASLQSCSLMVTPGIADGWIDALNVITQFINCLIRQERSAGVEEAELDLAILEYDRLPEERREEIRRHLDLIMTGALQDQLDAKYAAEAKRRRMAGNRTERAWKFFAPVPEPPRAVTLAEPEFGTGRRVATVVGATLMGGGGLVALLLTLPVHPVLALLFAAGSGGGGYLLATTGRAWSVSRELIAADDARYGPPQDETPGAGSLDFGVARFAAGRYAADPSEEEPDEHVWGDSDKADDKHRGELRRRDLFRSFVEPYVTACFADEDPDGATKRAEWRKATEGLRASLVADIQNRYAGPDLLVAHLTWLITWHAERAKRCWENGTLRARRDELAGAAPSGAAVFLGAVGMAAGLLCGLAGVLASGLGPALPALPVVIVGAWVAYSAEIDVYVVRRDVHAAESALAAAEFAEEQEAFERWTEVLADRPTDAEVARWLDYDKFYARELAMKACGLANRDLVAYATLTEALHPCQRARVLFGPPRYSRYRVIIFLLTEAGVRQVSVNLDFFDGTVSNQRRNNFQYSKISSARVHEVGIRFDSGRRKVIVIDEESGDREPPRDPKDIDSLILSQAFRLSLIDGQHIHIVVENFDHGFLDRLREDEDSLFELALDSSGVKSALRVLESVAAEGREWLTQERTRRTRRLLDFSRSFVDRRELPWAADDTARPRELEG
ncbi:hypothetical protein [Actinomadura rubrisoli]|uniref:Uncharacterized protein n=1 Tax=Actinomadura rubrisoli TaxID=2530368 RepID=A0A4R5B363_9ACTN|nr:hypothetical protein [Actinomadura rubrisoli]TDD78004.1 hypothetical protein E1298_29045 [Actinomadura rubrisoli]